MKCRIFYSHQVLKNYHAIQGKSNMQECLELPNLVYLTIYLFDLNEEVSLSLGIMVYDSQRQMLTSVILLCILYMVCIKNKYSNNINNERKKGKLYPLLFIIKR